MRTGGSEGLENLGKLRSKDCRCTGTGPATRACLERRVDWGGKRDKEEKCNLWIA